MPSEEFMQSILESDAAAAARGEVGEVEEPLAPEPEPEEDAEEDAEAEEEAEDEGDEDEADEPPEGDEEEAEEEPQAHEEEGDYGPFQSAEELKRGFTETRAFAQEQARARAALERELAEARELLAYQQGRTENYEGQRAPATSTEFQEWAEEMIEAGVPERGMAEVQAYGEETGDWSYAQRFADVWAEDDPYRAASARTFVDMAAALQRTRQAQEEPEEEYTGEAYDVQAAAQVIDQAREFLTQHYPDLQVGSPVLRGAVEQIKEDVRLHQMLRSGVYEDVVWAIEVARDRHLARTPRRARVSRADRERLDAEKTRLPDGDGARMNGRRQAVSGDVPPEFQDAMTQFAKWGMVREE